jgi:hypothetical protein
MVGCLPACRAACLRDWRTSRRVTRWNVRPATQSCWATAPSRYAPAGDARRCHAQQPVSRTTPGAQCSHAADDLVARPRLCKCRFRSFMAHACARVRPLLCPQSTQRCWSMSVTVVSMSVSMSVSVAALSLHCALMAAPVPGAHTAQPQPGGSRCVMEASLQRLHRAAAVCFILH